MNFSCLVIDIGNTVLHWGLSFDGKKISHTGKLRHFEADQLSAKIKEHSDLPARILVASVNPKPMPLLREGVNNQWALDYLELKAGSNWQPPTDVDQPSEVGVDRLVNARALEQIHPEGGIVVDHGTALTIDYVAARGVYSGGVIVPGIVMSMKALAEKTSLIPRISFEEPHSVIGKNTADCIRSGLYFGLVGLVQHLVLLMREQQGKELPVVVTGGDAKFLMQECRFDGSYEKELTLQGLLKVGWDINFWHE